MLTWCPRYLLVEQEGDSQVGHFHSVDHVAYEELLALFGAGSPPAEPLPNEPGRPGFMVVDGQRLVLVQVDGRGATAQALGMTPPFPLVWSGESEEGFHIGPVLEDMADVERYLRVLDRCRVLDDIEALVGSREAPTSAPFWVRHPQRLEEGVRRLLRCREPRRSAVLLETRRIVSLGWPTDLDPQTPSQTCAAHAWSKGLLYGADAPHQDHMGICHLSALVPNIQPADLAVCSGKGMTDEDAAIRLLGESVERLSAWLPSPNRAMAVGDVPAIPDAQLHATPVMHASPWLKTALPVVNLLDAADIRLAPKELVVLGPLPGARAFQSDTTGLAAHTSRRAAHTAALYECIERHNFYPGVTHLAPAVQCPALAHRLAQHSEAQVAANHVDTIIFTYPESLFAPVAHCFLFHHVRQLWVRGTGSGSTMSHAGEAAYVEAAQLMLRLQHELDSTNELPWEYRHCVDGEAFRLLHEYLRSQRETSGDEFDALPRATSFEASLKVLSAQGYRAYVHEFPRLFSSWWACRVVVPGFARSQQRDSPLGQMLIGDKLPFALPF